MPFDETVVAARDRLLQAGARRTGDEFADLTVRRSRAPRPRRRRATSTTSSRPTELGLPNVWINRLGEQRRAGADARAARPDRPRRTCSTSCRPRREARPLVPGTLAARTLELDQRLTRDLRWRAADTTADRRGSAGWSSHSTRCAATRVSRSDDGRSSATATWATEAGIPGTTLSSRPDVRGGEFESASPASWRRAPAKAKPSVGQGERVEADAEGCCDDRSRDRLQGDPLLVPMMFDLAGAAFRAPARPAGFYRSTAPAGRGRDAARPSIEAGFRRPLGAHGRAPFECWQADEPRPAMVRSDSLPRSGRRSRRRGGDRRDTPRRRLGLGTSASLAACRRPGPRARCCCSNAFGEF